MLMALEGSAVAAFERRRRALLRRGRIEAAVILLLFSALLLLSLNTAEFLTNDYGVEPLARLGAFLARMNPHLRADTLLGARTSEGSIAYWFYDAPTWARALLTSLEMALVATITGAAIALGASLLMARNLMPVAAVRQGVRRTLDVSRTLPDFILAMLLVQAVGTGPMAGVLALTITTFSSLSRPFAEASENADPRIMESVRAAGGGWPAQVRYGLLPLTLPNIVSLAFVMLEFNVSRSAALGIVGAGGIGEVLAGALAYNQFSTYFAIVLMTVALVMATDLTSEYLRHRLFGLGEAR